MLDGFVRPYIDPPLNKIAGRLAGIGVTPNILTSIGLVFAFMCFAALFMGQYSIALIFLILNRLCDGLDGPVARHPACKAGASDFGAYYDIVSDFTFYGGIPFFFALGNPEWIMASAVLLYSFILAGISFLGYAVIAEKRGLKTEQQGKKGFYYMAGLMEGTETILFFTAMMLMPAHYITFAYIFAGLCVITMLARLGMAYQVFKK